MPVKLDNIRKYDNAKYPRVDLMCFFYSKEIQSRLFKKKLTRTTSRKVKLKYFKTKHSMLCYV